MQNRKFGAITSSQDPEQIANSVKGIILAFSSIIILVAQQIFHIALSANDVISLGTEIGSVAGAVWLLYGLGLKALAYFFKAKPAVE